MDNNKNPEQEPVSHEGLTWAQIVEERYYATLRTLEAKKNAGDQRGMRVFLIVASTYAEALALHYTLRENEEEARRWAEKSGRHFRRAIDRTNKIAANIGGVMP